jgi:hypothetical protein
MHAHRTVHRHHAAALGSGPRRFAAVLLAALAIAVAPARATNVTTDVTDIWWPSSETGWGIQLIQNADVIFATMFVYGTENQPLFYVALLENPPAGGTGTWTGTLYVSHGSWFGAPWSPALAGEVAVGTMTFALTGIGTGTLDYTVGATSVSKILARQPLKLEDNSDTYRFTHTWTTSGAGCTADDTYAGGPHSGNMLILNVDPDTAVVNWQPKLTPVEFCTASMSYTQVGRFGQYQGTLNCPARTGSFTLFEVANRVKGLSGRYTIDWSYNCRHQGRFAGVSQSP